MISNISNNLNNFELPKNQPAQQSSITSKFNNLTKNQAYYAKKGEPIYQKDMDSDEDGVVTFDEFREYCQNNDVDVEQLLKNWLVYHASKDIEEKSENSKSDSEIIYAKKGDGKYEAVMDSNDDGKITYKEYLEYCRANAKEERKSSNTTQKAADEYTKSEPPEGKIETEA